ncbi:MAG: hypothetical protein WCR21_12425, partial [Bacteroidota bacterium]
MNNFSVTTLLSPFQNEFSNTAILSNNIGSLMISPNNYTANIFYGFELSPPNGDFNLFDNHGQFINISAGNMTITNNVFQNTQHYMASYGNGTNANYWHGGEAILSTNSSTGALYGLYMTPSNTSNPNLFYDCHTGVYAENLWKFNIEKNVFSSSHNINSLSSGTYVAQGDNGILLSTNRFMYHITKNEFYNLRTGIFIPLVSYYLPPINTGSNTPQQAPGWGIFAQKLAIEQNTLNAVKSGSIPINNFLNKAIIVTCPNASPVFMPVYNTSPLITGAFINNNNIKNTFRGITYNGLVGFKTEINNNTIELIDAPTTGQLSGQQTGIELLNVTSANNINYQCSVSNNTLNSTNTTNNLLSLVDCIQNTGLKSPSVTCNFLHDAPNGFVFNSTNPNSIWMGNKMQNLGVGLMLDNGGIMGIQGDNLTASNNQWLGATWTGTNYGTFVYNSYGQNSLIYFRNNGNTILPNNFGGGSVTPQEFYSASGNTITISNNAGDYQCGNAPNNKIFNLPTGLNFGDAFDLYIAQNGGYRFLHLNDSVRNSDTSYINFYLNLQGTNMGQLNLVEEKLMMGDLINAQSILSSVIPSNIIETNYKNFYEILIHYYTIGSYNSDDSLHLFNLANKCPGDEGQVVLQARALISAIYKLDLIYPVCGIAGNK